MQSFDTYHTYLAENLTVLRAACTTEAAIGTNADGSASCFFMAHGGLRGGAGIIPSSSFGSASLLRMDDLEASAEAGCEQTIMGALPDRLTKAVNAEIARSIVGALDGCDRTVRHCAVGSSSLTDAVARGVAALGENEVPVEDEDNMFVLGTPELRAALLVQVPRVDYVHVKSGNQQHKVPRWAGLNWLFAPQLQHSYALHRHAIGHALDLPALASPGAVTGGIDPKTGTGWMKAKTKQCAAVLQPPGIVRVTMAKA